MASRYCWGKMAEQPENKAAFIASRKSFPGDLQPKSRPAGSWPPKCACGHSPHTPFLPVKSVFRLFWQAEASGTLKSSGSFFWFELRRFLLHFPRTPFLSALSTLRLYWQIKGRTLRPALCSPLLYAGAATFISHICPTSILYCRFYKKYSKLCPLLFSLCYPMILSTFLFIFSNISKKI